MAFEPEVIFPGVLFDGAKRYANDAASATTAASIIQEMGWAATLIPEADGGFGGRVDDLGSLIEAMASRAINLPIITRCAIVPAMLNAAPADSPANQLQQRIAAGEVCVEFAGPLTSRESLALPAVSASAKGLSASGTLALAELSPECSHVLFNATDVTTGAPQVVYTDVASLREQAASYHTVEGRNLQNMALSAFALTQAQILATGEAAIAMQSSGWQIAQVAIAVDIVSTMNYALAETLRYLQERKQFGLALAQFQVLRHDAAKLYVTFESCRCLLLSSLRSLDDAMPLAERAAAFDLLGLYTREHAIEFAQSVIQLHGGMGMTQETLAARMATRLIALAFRYGDAYSHTKALGGFQGASAQ